jgi:hypothetical protein
MHDETTDPAIVAAIQAYIDTLNRRDLDGVRAALHFPHVLMGAGQLVFYPSADAYTFAAFDARTAHQNWSNSSWDGHKVVLAGPDKVHVDVWFTRWRGDGTAIGVHHSLYTVTRIAGRWGIQSRSSYG